MSETALSKSIRVAIKRHFPEIMLTRLQAGIIVDKSGYRVHCAEKGWADLIAIVPGGKFLGIEVKTKTGKASPEQILWREKATKLGAIAIEVNGVLDCIRKLREVLSEGKVDSW